MQKINKISKKTVVLFSILIGLSYYTNAQISCATTTNVACNPGDYLGWASTVGRPLDIKNNGNYSIDFYTNTNARMQIRNNGNVGIGNFAAPFSAAERLHLRESSGNPSVFLMTGNNTGDNASDGFHISLNNNATATLQSVDLNLMENSNMNFLTNNTQRMRITGDGNVGIGSVTPVGKLFVVNDVNTTVLAPAVYANSTATTSGYSATGVQSLASASGSGGDTYAIDAQASGSGNFNVALKLLTTSNASNNYGIYSNMGKGIGYYSTVTGTSGSTTEQNGGITVEVANGAYVGGVSGKASNGVTSNTGGTFEANGGTNIANWNVGVHGIAQYGYASGCINRGVHGFQIMPYQLMRVHFMV